MTDVKGKAVVTCPVVVVATVSEAVNLVVEAVVVLAVQRLGLGIHMDRVWE